MATDEHPSDVCGGTAVGDAGVRHVHGRHAGAARPSLRVPEPRRAARLPVRPQRLLCHRRKTTVRYLLSIFFIFIIVLACINGSINETQNI